MKKVPGRRKLLRTCLTPENREIDFKFGAKMEKFSPCTGATRYENSTESEEASLGDSAQ